MMLTCTQNKTSKKVQIRVQLYMLNDALLGLFDVILIL